MNKSVTGLIALTVASLSPLVDAEERKGFYLAGGLGLSANTFEASFGGDSNSESGYRGILTSFKIGGHFNPNFALYYQREASFFSDDAGDSAHSGIAGIGATYYFEPNGGMYIEGGIGIADFISEDAGIEGIGGGAMFGIGGEITDHLDGGFVLMATGTDDTSFEGLEYDILSIGAKLTLKL